MENPAQAAPDAARYRLASLQTIIGSFPPSSSEGEKPRGGGGHQLLSDRDRSGEKQLIHAGGNERVAGDVSGDVHQVEKAFGEVAGGNDVADEHGDLLGLGGDFQEDGIAGHQGHHDFVEGDGEGIIPGADDPDHPVRHALDMGFFVEEKDIARSDLFRLQKLLGFPGVICRRHRRRQDLGAEGIDSRFSVIPGDDLGDVVGPGDDGVPDGEDMPGPFFEAGRGPAFLGDPGSFQKGVQVVRVILGMMANDFAGRRINADGVTDFFLFAAHGHPSLIHFRNSR